VAGSIVAGGNRFASDIRCGNGILYDRFLDSPSSLQVMPGIRSRRLHRMRVFEKGKTVILTNRKQMEWR